MLALMIQPNLFTLQVRKRHHELSKNINVVVINIFRKTADTTERFIYKLLASEICWNHSTTFGIKFLAAGFNI